jgi:hypothetical protein
MQENELPILFYEIFSNMPKGWMEKIPQSWRQRPNVSTNKK